MDVSLRLKCTLARGQQHLAPREALQCLHLGGASVKMGVHWEGVF